MTLADESGGAAAAPDGNLNRDARAPTGTEASGAGESHAAGPAQQHSGTTRSEGELARGAGARLFFTEWAPAACDRGASARAIVVVMHGFGEHSGRYDEFAGYLVARGYAVARIDARGHGRSSGRRGHVSDYDDYVGDLAAFALDIAHRHSGSKLILLGHSNGGLAAIRCVQRELIQPHALVLTSPLLRLRKQPVPDGLARVLSRFLPALPLPNGIRSEDLTRDTQLRAAHASDRWVHKVATPRWYWEMREAQRQALADAPRITLPLLTICAELDALVDPAATIDFHGRAASLDKELVVRSGEYHEVLNEIARLESFERIASWMDRVLGASSRGPLSCVAPALR